MLTRLLIVLPLLVCPLLMLLCMWAMRGMGNPKTPQAGSRAGYDEMPTTIRVAQLEHELAELRSRLPNAVPTGQTTPRSQPEPPREVPPTGEAKLTPLPDDPHPRAGGPPAGRS